MNAQPKKYTDKQFVINKKYPTDQDAMSKIRDLIHGKDLDDIRSEIKYSNLSLNNSLLSYKKEFSSRYDYLLNSQKDIQKKVDSQIQMAFENQIKKNNEQNKKIELLIQNLEAKISELHRDKVNRKELSNIFNFGSKRLSLSSPKNKSKVS